MFLRNLPLFQGENDPEQEGEEERHDKDQGSETRVSVLIPARDEAAGIDACVKSILCSENVTLEVLVLDDHSSDRTPLVVNQIAGTDDRVRCLEGKSLPAGWNGKQYACFQLSQAASYEHFVFLDADVRLSPNTLRKVIDRKCRDATALLSLFPQQQTGTIAEKLFIPMMHFILLGFLPFERMRSSVHPAYAAGCGQFFLTTKREYQQAGTHQVLADSRHDGIKLPKAYRRADLSTDVIDGTNLAQCRMYDSTAQVINGVLKNAVEGIAHPARIVPFTILLLGSTVLPIVVAVFALGTGNLLAAFVAILAVLVSHVPRMLAATSFRQSWLSVICHSFATLAFVCLQWVALTLHLCGKQVTWRGRT
jgi:hypothetical protein